MGQDRDLRRIVSIIGPVRREISESSMLEGQTGPWNPGTQSQMPAELRHLCTMFRTENVLTSVDGAAELHGLTGFSPSELVVFRPQRLVLHELLIRVTADFVVPDGSRIGDLGINFREMASQILVRYIAPQMDSISAAFEQDRRRLRDAVDAALSAVVSEPAPKRAELRRPASWLFARLARRRGGAIAADSSWGPPQIARCERMAADATNALQEAACRALARVMSALFAAHGRAWGDRNLIVSLATDMACNDYGSDALGGALP